MTDTEVSERVKERSLLPKGSSQDRENLEKEKT